VEILRENELHEPRAILRARFASEGLRTPQLSVGSDFQPAGKVGGDFLD
jgi:hypothetical protein